MKMFKSSVRGFKKSDVNNYIIEMHREFADIKEKYETEISALKAELDVSRAHIERLAGSEAKCTRLQSELDTALSKISEYEDKNTEYTEKMRYAEDALTTLADRVVELENTNSDLRSALSDAEKNTIHSKNVDADGLNSGATVQRIRKTEEALKHMTENTVKNLNSVICEGADSFINDLRNYAEKLMFTSKAAADGLAGEYGEMAEKVFFYFDALKKSTAQSIAEFKNESEVLCGQLNDKSQNGVS